MKKLSWYCFAVVLCTFLSCEDEKNSKIEVWLTDAPANFKEVNIDVQGVEIHSSETDHERGWQALEVTPRVVNLLNLTNGRELHLGDLELPGGRISQLRLKLGENNSVMVDDAVYSLSTPSAQQSGLKLQIHQILAEGITYKILLDFEAGKSIVQSSATSYSLKPVIRAVMEAKDGGIKGTISPAQVVSIAVNIDGETVSTTSSNEDGEFMVRGLEQGTYTLVFDAPGDAPLVEKTAVDVALGGLTDIGIINMPE
jgi:hypothetical protein